MRVGETCAELGDTCETSPWINEFHYDDTGGDNGEFIEVAIASGIDIDGVTVTLYDGMGGAPYVAGGLSAHPLNTFTAGTTVNGITFYSKLISGIQNGAPDGFSLDVSGALIEFISYEGSFAGVGGPANGVMSTDIGVSEDGTGAAGISLGRVGNGRQASDFTWAAIADDTPGDVNSGQTITP